MVEIEEKYKIYEKISQSQEDARTCWSLNHHNRRETPKPYLQNHHNRGEIPNNYHPKQPQSPYLCLPKPNLWMNL